MVSVCSLKLAPQSRVAAPGASAHSSGISFRASDMLRKAFRPSPPRTPTEVCPLGGVLPAEDGQHRALHVYFERAMAASSFGRRRTTFGSVKFLELCKLWLQVVVCPASFTPRISSSFLSSFRASDMLIAPGCARTLVPRDETTRKHGKFRRIMSEHEEPGLVQLHAE